MTDSTIEVLDTLPKQFLHKVKLYGENKVAVRQKEFGIWQEYTWLDAHKGVREICLGLISLGLQNGDRVCIVGDNDAIQTVRGDRKRMLGDPCQRGERELVICVKTGLDLLSYWRSGRRSPSSSM
jgi:hypothetical protein